jgi:hypothetical protein
MSHASNLRRFSGFQDAPMQQFVSVTQTTFEDALTPESLRATQIIHVGLMSGALIFTAAVFFLYATNVYPVATPAAIEAVSTLTFIHLACAVLAPFLGFFLAGRIFSPERWFEGFNTEERALAARCIVLQRTANIVRMAVMEGAVLFGLAVCTIAVTSGVLTQDGNYWVNLLSTAVLFFAGLATFPTKERLVAWFGSAMQRG